ncbi:peptidyl-prolyl cis-trans isomerase [Dokdonella sp.]|uniref:peptidylprolyl isomerase n=1 Tax=Dokdonella sp. TaxID=2291710 RepID=UPI003527374D
MSRILHEPLVHFLILGTLLFVLYASVKGGSGAPDEILVTRGQVDNLRSQFSKVWQREPSRQELDGLVENWVREEVLYREGRKLGLDVNDQVIRRRVMQKIEFLAEGATPQVPTPAELQAWLDAHPDDYQIEPRYSLTQIYFDPSRHGDALEADVIAARKALLEGKPVESDTTQLPATLRDRPLSEIVRVFGSRLGDSIASMETGQWSEPLASGFGVHLVRIDLKEPGRVATLAEAKKAVERDLLYERTMQGKQAFYLERKSNYTVRMEPATPEADPETAGP